MNYLDSMRRLVTTCVLGVSLWGCDDLNHLIEPPEHLYIMSQMSEHGSGGPVPGQVSCYDLNASGATGAGMGTSDNDFWMSEEASKEGLKVEVGSQEQTLEQRFYDRDFARSQEVDRFTVTTVAGKKYDFVYWGGNFCERTAVYQGN